MTFHIIPNSNLPFNNCTSVPRHSIIQALQQMIQSRIDVGWSASLLTFEFMPLAGNEVTQVRQIQKLLEGFYSLSLTRFVRHPKRRGLLDLPLMLSMADYPVAKRQKTKNIATNNDGLHAHAVYQTPPNKLLRSDAKSVFARWEHLFVRKCHLQSLHVRAITETPAKAVAYVMKSLELGRFDESHIWLLPKTQSEVRHVANVSRSKK